MRVRVRVRVRVWVSEKVDEAAHPEPPEDAARRQVLEQAEAAWLGLGLGLGFGLGFGFGFGLG